MSVHSILFVDDEPAVLDAIARGFRKTPFEIFTATSGSEALDLLHARAISVIVSDYDMPGMNGTELLSLCRERWPDTIRIMLTGGANLNAALGATFGGWVYQYLEKPIAHADLLAVIHEAIQMLGNTYGAEYARLLLPPDVQRSMLAHLRITSSPDRPTFVMHSSPIEWALELCNTNQLPPELDRFRTLVGTLNAVAETVMSTENPQSADEKLAHIRALVRKIY